MNSFKNYATDEDLKDAGQLKIEGMENNPLEEVAYVPELANQATEEYNRRVHVGIVESDEVVVSADEVDNLDDLHNVMFKRRIGRGKDTKFFPLYKGEKEMVREELGTYSDFHVEGEHLSHLKACTDKLRGQTNSDESEINGDEYREIMYEVAMELLIQEIESLKEKGMPLKKMVLVLPWRAALAFALPAAELGITNFYHIDAKRNDDTLETDIRYTNPAGNIDLENPENNANLHAVVVDPALATGMTDVSCLDIMNEHGIQHMSVVGVWAADVGVFNIKKNYPDTSVRVSALDDELNVKGYIKSYTGKHCNDAGDNMFHNATEETLNQFTDAKVLNETDLERIWSSIPSLPQEEEVETTEIA